MRWHNPRLLLRTRFGSAMRRFHLAEPLVMLLTVVQWLVLSIFTGAVIGLYATGAGKRSTVPADFDWFEYAPLAAP